MKKLLNRIATLPTEKVLTALLRLPGPIWVLLALITFLLTVPLIVTRSFHFEEGLTVAFAKASLERSFFYPDLYGITFNERPVLLSWMASVISHPLGNNVGHIAVRIPVVLSLFAGMWLIYDLVTASLKSSRAGLFAALCFACCPLVIVKVTVAESDLILSVFQLGAFHVWWFGYKTGRTSWTRWLIVGLLLAATALFKGPQPVAFFALGVGLFLLLKREWGEIPGYILSGVISAGTLFLWYSGIDIAENSDTIVKYWRLDEGLSVGEYIAERLDIGITAFAQFLPSSFLLPFAYMVCFRGEKEQPEIRALVLALALYAGTAGAALYFWPGANVRYGIPAVMATAVIVGLVFEEIFQRFTWFARVACLIVISIGLLQIVQSWILSPLLADEYRYSKTGAEVVKQTIGPSSETLYAEYREMDNFLAYLQNDRPIYYVNIRTSFDELPKQGLILMQLKTVVRLRNEHPEINIEQLAEISKHKKHIVLMRIRPTKLQ